MRTAAEVGEGAVGIEGDGSVLERINQFAFVVFATGGEGLERVGLCHVGADKVLFLARQFEHLLLNLRQVGLDELLLAEIHVIVEAVLDGRANAELHLRIEQLKRLRHQV